MPALPTKGSSKTDSPNSVQAGAYDEGFKFVLQGGLRRDEREGHLSAIVGRGGTGKSILALQLVTDLLDAADEAHKKRVEQGKAKEDGLCNAAFYFTLEASPKELLAQVDKFSWGGRYAAQETPSHNSAENQEDKAEGHEEDKAESQEDNKQANGLHLISIPSPAESLNALTLKIRQSIAGQLFKIRNLVAIVIDPMGAINSTDGLEPDFVLLKELADSHGTFVLMLSEKHTFERYRAIEHYSQSIIHLEYDPGNARHHRYLYIQKARGQSFRSGFHPFDLYEPSTSESKISNTEVPLSAAEETPEQRRERYSVKPPGIRVFPSIEAQSAEAHEAREAREPQQSEAQLFAKKDRDESFGNLKIVEGSAIFLMGPPGTFKERVASKFVDGAFDKESGTSAALYLSFKTDREKDQIELHSRKLPRLNQELEPGKGKIFTAGGKTFFYSARNPVLKPEEMLFTIRNAIRPPVGEGVRFKRAVVWGLRRLYDFPNVKEVAVQFLEALVTMLSSQGITTMLVDWPDKASAATVPIVDLCQYTLLTRVCYRPEEIHLIEKFERSDTARSLNFLAEKLAAPTFGEPGTAKKTKKAAEQKNNAESAVKVLNELWSSEEGAAQQVALLRVQRALKDVRHDRGFVYRKVGASGEWKVASAKNLQTDANFDSLWTHYTKKWEDDLSLQS